MLFIQGYWSDMIIDYNNQSWTSQLWSLTLMINYQLVIADLWATLLFIINLAPQMGNDIFFFRLIPPKQYVLWYSSHILTENAVDILYFTLFWIFPKRNMTLTKRMYAGIRNGGGRPDSHIEFLSKGCHKPHNQYNATKFTDFHSNPLHDF